MLGALTAALLAVSVAPRAHAQTPREPPYGRSYTWRESQQVGGAFVAGGLGLPFLTLPAELEIGWSLTGGYEWKQANGVGLVVRADYSHFAGRGYPVGSPPTDVQGASANLTSLSGGVRFVQPRGAVLTYLEGSLGVGYSSVGWNEVTDYATGASHRVSDVTWRGVFSLMSGTMLRPGGSVAGYLIEFGIVSHAGADTEWYMPLRIGVTFGGE
jgi:hypothetical protein